MSKGSEGLRLQSDHDDVRLAVSTSEGLSNPIISEPVVSANNRIHYINMVFSGWIPAEFGPVISARILMQQKVLHATFASCAKTGSTSPVFTNLKDLNPLFFIHM